MQQNQGMVYYENEDCRISYNLWSEQGTVTFSILNKTDSIISIDLTKTFFIRNGLSNPYFQARQWTKKTTVGRKTTTIKNNTNVNYNASEYPDIMYPEIQHYTSNTNINSKTTASTFTTTASKSESKIEQQIIRIAPHSLYYLSEFYLRTKPFFDCDLKTHPMYNKQSSIRYTQETTPLQFSNYITYKVGDKAQQHIENKFYVSKVSNFQAKSLKNKVRISQCGKYRGKEHIYIFPVENKTTAFFIPYTYFTRQDDNLSIEVIKAGPLSGGITNVSSMSTQPIVEDKQNAELQKEYLALQDAKYQSSGDKSLLGKYKRANLVVINASSAEDKECEKYRKDFMYRFNELMTQQWYKNFTFKNNAQELTAELIIIDYNNDVASGFIRFKDASDSVLYSRCLTATPAGTNAAGFASLIENEF